MAGNSGEWMKGKIIGSGSFGTVHLAINRSNGSLFVVKSAESRAGIESLENEANILENLNSPNIVRCIGRDVSHGGNGDRKINLFMEYMAAGSLADVIEKFGGKLDEKVIGLYTREILEGLKYLHRNGIVHCDLKCKNVLLGSCGNIKLADFGCAKRLNGNWNWRRSCKSFICGTPLWMAPEVLRNEGLDFSADIWSLGCSVIEMATGKPPWGDGGISNPMAAVLRIASSNEMPQFPGQFSEVGLDFVGKCLDRNPKKRWTVEELVNHPFVLGESEGRNSGKGNASSPASVLDVGVWQGDFEWEERNILGRIPFSSRMRISTQRTELVSSENWVTVRTG